MKIVIIGGGPAALESAVSARKTDPEAEISVYSAEDCLPYRRPALSGLLGAGKKVDEKSFFIKPASFFADEKINFFSGCKAVKIDGNSVIFDSGNSVEFDSLILACGGNAVRPPVPGVEQAYILRTKADMDKLHDKLESGVKSAVIVGGGVLGLEIADSLLSRQISTVVMEASAQLFPARLAPADAAALYERLSGVENLRIVLNARVVNVASDAVTLADGEVFPADVVIFATGSRPELALAQSAGLACDRGVIVDEFMTTSRKDIFAAGDVAQFNGKCFNLYMDAVASGKSAGANAAGAHTPFAAKETPMRLMALGEKLVM